MPSTRSRGDLLLLFDPELNRTLRRMNEPFNLNNIGDGINRQLPTPVDARNEVIVENPDDGVLRRQPPIPRPQEIYRVNINITDSDGPLFLPPLPQGHTFFVTTSLFADNHHKRFVFGATI